MGESVQKDMIAVPLGGPSAVCVVGAPTSLERHPAPKHPGDLAQHNGVRFRFSTGGGIYKWEFTVDGQVVDYEVTGSLTISDSLFALDAALEGVGLAYTLEQLALPHVRARRLTRVLSEFSPTFPGFYLYYPSRRQQASKMRAFVD